MMITIAQVKALIEELDLQLYEEERDRIRRVDIMACRNGVRWLSWDMEHHPEKWRRYGQMERS